MYMLLFHLFLFLEVLFPLLLYLSHCTFGDADIAKQGINPSFVCCGYRNRSSHNMKVTSCLQLSPYDDVMLHLCNMKIRLLLGTVNQL
jgi:hypothetical protein